MPTCIRWRATLFRAEFVDRLLNLKITAVFCKAVSTSFQCFSTEVFFNPLKPQSDLAQPYSPGFTQAITVRLSGVCVQTVHLILMLGHINPRLCK